MISTFSEQIALGNIPEAYGYRVDGKTTFCLLASPDLQRRADDVSIGDGGYSWVLWDPADDVNGYLLTADNPAALRKAFADDFPDLPEDGTVLGLDRDGCLLLWDGDKRAVYNCGETVEQFGADNLDAEEKERLGL